MESKAKLFGHPIHQMLIVFPLGLLATALILDIIYLITDSGKWAQAAFYDMGIGILGGLLAALLASRSTVIPMSDHTPARVPSSRDTEPERRL